MVVLYEPEIGFSLYGYTRTQEAAETLRQQGLTEAKRRLQETRS